MISFDTFAALNLALLVGLVAAYRWRGRRLAFALGVVSPALVVALWAGPWLNFSSSEFSRGFMNGLLDRPSAPCDGREEPVRWRPSQS